MQHVLPVIGQHDAGAGSETWPVDTWPAGAAKAGDRPTVIVIEESGQVAPQLVQACEYLGLALHAVRSERGLATALSLTCAVAVVAEADMQEQDGFNAMRLAGAHDPDLPFLLIVGEEPWLLGAADAVEEAMRMTGVLTRRAVPTAGELVEFLARAAAPGGTRLDAVRHGAGRVSRRFGPRRRTGIRPSAASAS